ncbi:PQQ-dependent sugar dehydrogenase [Frigoriglobus tundricola]|uniref:Glucose/L-sorbosone dehydrogenase, distantly related to bacterial beta-galactosidase n=1 Tax=Frigoriglobus tundricola TaxID=2774151 RepID=A0A6M5Z473_9BACT|nr:PQQ-dependent sugar dehydrogenase [Frigoriglobus tundricola]QJX00311.1 glucose/L-sorbosone dehydrogenase, distantly related to bacterial beta-galactosidase [Frigoriglobus tundricola]
MSPLLYTRTAAAAVGFAVIGLALAWPLKARDEKPPLKDKGDANKRQPWTTSKVVGSPEPPPKYKSARVFPNAKFNHPLLIARCPGTERLFVGEQEGLLYSLANKPDAKPDVFLDLRKEYPALVPNAAAKGIGELYGLVFHPQFEKNRFCYVCYTLEKKDGTPGRIADGSRVSRFKVTDTDPPRIDAASEEIVITFQGGGHNGGDLHFGRDGFLYISTGDGSGPNPPDPLNTGQDCSDLLSSILRIDVDKKETARNYAVPKDNPFLGIKDVRPEIWAFGFRNPWRMSIDRMTGDLWVGDVGWELWEMVHRVEKGGNYGWSIVEGRQPVKPDQKIGPAPIRPPLLELPHTIACSVTGGYVYRGKKFPELVGAYIFGDWETRRIWAARFEEEKAGGSSGERAGTSLKLKEMPEIVKPNIRVSAFGEDNAGELYFLEYDTGVMYTLEKNDAGAANAQFPTKLSETGIFADVARHTPALGVIPFYPNARQWQDGATADYLLALPDLSTVTFFSKPRPLPGQVFWHDFKMAFPKDTVLVKTLSLDVLNGNRQIEKRIETQLLHFDGDDWRGYSYAWRDDQTDADLVPIDGAEKAFPVAAGGRAEKGTWAPTGTREQVWTYHSRTQCITCHNSWSEYALAFTASQLNRAPLFAGGGVPNQLVRLTTQGYARRVAADDKELPPFDPKAVKNEPALAPLHGADSLDARARSYLHVNCAHCHRFGGGGGQVVLELDVAKPLNETAIFDVRPKQGDFGLPDARILAPGDPYRSVLFYRMAKFGRGRMPHLGSVRPHTQGLDVMAEWIASLGKPAKSWELPPASAEGAGKALTTFQNGWPYARALALGKLEGPSAEALLTDAAKLPAGPTRDLFEGHLPVGPGGRKLGANPRPATILALTGDAKSGEVLFFNKEMKCANCHKIGDRGTALGPDLSLIGKTRTRAELLDSLLNPSARVEPQFAAYNVRTLDEKSYTGIVVKRDEKQLTLRDAENREVVIAGDTVESVRPSRLSLMPDGQMAGLTPQQAADLLEYLVQRK